MKLLIVDDQKMVAESLKLALEQSMDFNEIVIATSGKEALSILENKTINIAIVDLEMPQMDGIELCERIQESHRRLKVLVLSVNIKSSTIRKLYIETKVEAYLPRYIGLQDLIYAIKVVQSGQRYIYPEIKPLLEIELPILSLTERQLEITKLLSQGFSEKEIAAKLFLSPKTVRRHKDDIAEKLEVKTVTEIQKEYLKFKWLSTDKEEDMPPFKN